jgi:hypothetical protein
VYLHVINSFESAYFPNLAKFLPDIPVTAGLIASALHRYRPTYQNEFGHVWELNAPSDGWNIFERLFDDHDKLAPSNREYLRQIISTFETIYSGPFINKNNRNCLRIPPLAETFPEARFIGVVRNTESAAISLAEARKAHDVAPDEWWGCPPPAPMDMPPQNQIEMSLYTIESLSRWVTRQLGALPDERVKLLAYEDFCTTPNQVTDWLSNEFAQTDFRLSRRLERPAAHFAPHEYTDSLPTALRQKVERQVQKTMASLEL